MTVKLVKITGCVYIEYDFLGTNNLFIFFLKCTFRLLEKFFAEANE